MGAELPLVERLWERRSHALPQHDTQGRRQTLNPGRANGGADEFPVGRTLNPVKPPLFSKITYIVHFLYKLCYTHINVSHYPNPMRSICDKLIF